MTFLHQSNVYLGDLKPANILIYNQEVKLFDMGVSLVVHEDQKHCLKGWTPKYSNLEGGNRCYTKKELVKADIYALFMTWKDCSHKFLEN